MAISEARHRANEKYNAKAYEEIKVRVPKGKKEVIQAAAKASGESVNSYINRAIDLLMGGGYGFQSGKGEENITSRFFSHTAIFSEAELEEMTALLQNGQTIEDFIRAAVRNEMEIIKSEEES